MAGQEVGVVVRGVGLEDMAKHHTGRAAVVRSSEEGDSASPPQAFYPGPLWSCLFSAYGLDVATATVAGRFVHVRKWVDHAEQEGLSVTYAGTSLVGSGQATSQWPF